jgi:FAD/FMN-containing dehydrogenase
MFNEMEYELPAENGIACLEEVLATIRRAKVNVFYPLEFRFVKQDDCWMSPFYKQDSASISLHQYTKQDHWELFKVAEPVFRKYGGRPHWGKIHSLSHAELCELYPKWDEFHALRRELDPNGKFMNVYLKHIMGS